MGISLVNSLLKISALKLATLLLATSVLAQEEPARKPSANAGCMIRLEDRLLMVMDFWSDRWSLPGGTTESGETPEETAARETLEETGIDVEVGPLLNVAKNGFHIFACKAESIPTRGGKIYPLLEFAFEIKKVEWIDLQKIADSSWRFRSESALIKSLFEKVESSPVSALEEQEPLERGHLLGMQLSFLNEFAKWRTPFLDVVFKIFNFCGELPIFVLALILLMIFCELNSAYFFYLVAGSALLVQAFLKEWFQVLRPFYYEPALSVSGASGFSFPSGHATLAAAVLLLYGIGRGRSSLVIAGIVAVLVGVARMYMGVHFPMDIAGGIFLGACAVAGAVYFKTIKYWEIAFVACMLPNFLPAPSTPMISLFGGLAGFLVASVVQGELFKMRVDVEALDWKSPSRGWNSKVKWMGLAGALGIVAIAIVWPTVIGWLQPSENTFLVSVAMKFISFFVLTLITVILSLRLRRALLAKEAIFRARKSQPGR